jgi:aminopeptidase-like protein
MSIGIKIYKLAEKLWPLNRSITGQGVRETLKVLKKICPDLKIKNVDSGTDVFDWKVPDEWQVKSAYIISPDGNKICDFSKNNLHLVSYSVKTKKILNLIDLKKKLYSLPRLPDAIPYKTSYYHKDWGFCISHNQKKKFKKRHL